MADKINVQGADIYLRDLIADIEKSLPTNGSESELVITEADIFELNKILKILEAVKNGNY